MRPLVLAVLVACGAPKQPAPAEPVAAPEDATPIDAAIDAPGPRTYTQHAIANGVLTSATKIAIADEWSGLGCSYKFTATLERHGDVFVGTAAFDTYRTKSNDKRDVSLSVYEVEALQLTLSTADKQPEPPPLDPRRGWTDDYPSGSSVFAGPQGTVKVFFRDQTRQMLVEHGGRIQAFGEPELRPGGPISEAWERYRAFLDAVGLGEMRHARCARWGG